jgi:hypothetical protein
LLTWLSSLCFDAKSVYFIIDRIDVWFLGCNSKYRFRLFYYPQEEVLINFIQKFLAHRHTLLLLLIVEHLSHKLHSDSPFVQVLFWNSLACSVQEA